MSISAMFDYVFTLVTVILSIIAKLCDLQLILSAFLWIQDCVDFYFLRGVLWRFIQKGLQYTNDFILILWKILLRDVGIYSIVLSFIKKEGLLLDLHSFCLWENCLMDIHTKLLNFFPTIYKYGYFSSKNKFIMKGEITNLFITNIPQFP